MYDKTLAGEFGSWAGGFSASGDIYYDKDHKQIIVTGSQSNDEGVHFKTVELDLAPFFTEGDKKRVDSVAIYFTNSDGTRVRINVTNGPWTPSLQAAEDAIQEALERISAEYPDDEDYIYYEDEVYTLDTPMTVSIRVKENEDVEFCIDLKEKEVEDEA